ncbi:MAG TPA: ATPase domain-containing protein, partial [Candidatus Nanoarchaeia archaeon]|nr:ATPase domain-containing protein [Candidatus Nanoarchaeia archaeon]
TKSTVLEKIEEMQKGIRHIENNIAKWIAEQIDAIKHEIRTLEHAVGDAVSHGISSVEHQMHMTGKHIAEGAHDLRKNIAHTIIHTEHVASKAIAAEVEELRHKSTIWVRKETTLIKDTVSDIEHKIGRLFTKEVKNIKESIQELEQKAHDLFTKEEQVKKKELKQEEKERELEMIESRRERLAAEEIPEVKENIKHLEQKATKWISHEVSSIREELREAEHKLGKMISHQVSAMKETAHEPPLKAEVEHATKNINAWVQDELHTIGDSLQHAEQSIGKTIKQTIKIITEDLEKTGSYIANKTRQGGKFISRETHAAGEAMHSFGENVQRMERKAERWASEEVHTIAEGVEHAKDKVVIKITDLLKSHHDGLTITDIMKKLNLARHTVLARLHTLVGKGLVGIKKINMAKIHFWTHHARPQESEVNVNPIEEEHITLLEKGEVERPTVQEIDLDQLKEEITEKVKEGLMDKQEAQIEEQRAPITHIVERARHGTKRVDRYVKTGIEGLDELFEEGIPVGSSVLLAGGAGSGKTILGLEILKEHAKHGEKCLYMSFEESEDRLIHHMEDFGWKPDDLIRKKNLMIKRFNPFDITRSVDALLMKAKGELLIDLDPVILPENFKPDFIVVDSLTAIASAFTGKEDSYRIYIEQLFRFFEKIGATSFLIAETKQIPTVFSQTGVEEFLADGVIVLYNLKRGNVRENAIEVLKLRGAGHQKRIVAFQVTDKGFVVYPEQQVFGNINLDGET